MLYVQHYIYLFNIKTHISFHCTIGTILMNWNLEIKKFCNIILVHTVQTVWRFLICRLAHYRLRFRPSSHLGKWSFCYEAFQDISWEWSPTVQTLYQPLFKEGRQKLRELQCMTNLQFSYLSSHKLVGSANIYTLVSVAQ